MKPKYVLFIDEESWYIDDLIIHLEYKYTHCKHDYAYNGIQAHDLLGLRTYDCIILDIMMPYGTLEITDRFAGLRILEEIRQANKSVPIICYTARDEETIITTIRKYPKTHLVSKNESTAKFWETLELYIK